MSEGLNESGPSRKEQIISLYESGVTEVDEICRRARVRPSYVAQVLQAAGHMDRWSTSEHNIYSRFFRNVVSLKSVEEAEESCVKLTRTFDYFERLGDRAGQHQAMVVALDGMNRSRWAGNYEVARVYGRWLRQHLVSEQED